MTTTAHSIYTGRVTNWPFVALSAVLAVPLLAFALTGTGPAGGLVVPFLIVLAAVAVNALTAGSVRTAAGPNGVAVRFGALGWPRGTYPLAAIARAEVVEVPWWAVAFGYWWTPRHTHCTVRSGPALRLHLTSGRRVTVTVPDPHAAAAALHAPKTTA